MCVSVVSTGDSKIKFADYAIKVNRRNKMQKRVILVTENGIYNMVPETYKIVSCTFHTTQSP